MLIDSHLAAFCTAFCTKTPSIYHQNALRFASNRNTFSRKQPPIWYN